MLSQKLSEHRDKTHFLNELSNIHLSLSDRLKKLKLNRADVVDIFDEPGIEDEWIKLNKAKILTLMLPDMLHDFVKSALDAPYNAKPSYLKLYFQVMGMLKEEDHKHVHIYQSMSDAELEVEIERTQKMLKDTMGHASGDDASVSPSHVSSAPPGADISAVGTTVDVEAVEKPRQPESSEAPTEPPHEDL